jgi:hypothetical protein
MNHAAEISALQWACAENIDKLQQACAAIDVLQWRCFAMSMCRKDKPAAISLCCNEHVQI